MGYIQWDVLGDFSDGTSCESWACPRVSHTNIFKTWRLEDKMFQIFSFWKLHLLVPYWLFGLYFNIFPVVFCKSRRTPMEIHQWSSPMEIPPAAVASSVVGWQLGTWRFAGHRPSWLHSPSPWGVPWRFTMKKTWILHDEMDGHFSGFTSNIHETCGFTKLIELVRKIPFRAHCYKIFPFLIDPIWHIAPPKTIIR